jgi:hypothetical protein
MRPDVMLSRSKRTSEEFRLQWDFVNDIEATDTRSAFEVKAFDVASGSDVSVTFLQGATWVGTGPVIGVQIQAGTEGHDYDVRFQLTTTQGDIFQRVVRVGVKA